MPNDHETRIQSRVLFNAVHHVYDRLPSEARARLGRMNLELVTDEPSPVLEKADKLGMCVRLPGGLQQIYLSPRLARESAETISNVIAHELAHACQEHFHGYDWDEAYAKAHADEWAPSAYPKTDWKG